MALDVTRLGSALANAMTSVVPGTDATIALAIGMAQAAAIINEFKNNANVLPTALVAPAGGGPVTGTGTVT